MAKTSVGLDVGSSSCHLVALDQEGRMLCNVKFTTSEAKLIAAVAGLPGEVHVHFEASELAGWVHSVFHGRVARIVVSHAKTNAWIANDPLKSDRRDAFKLAELLRLGRVHEVYYPADESRRLFKYLVQHYDDVTDQEIRLKLKIKARLRAQGIIIKGRGVYGARGRLLALQQIAAPAARQMIEQLYAVLDYTLQTQHEALALLRRQARQYPEVERFQTVPGVGLIGAARFSAYIQTPHRFSSKRKLWRYCRLGITERSSDGKPLGRKRLDHAGNGRLKDLSRKAFNGALHTRADNAFKRTYRQALARTHNATHARLTTQRKLLAVLRALWKGGTTYQDEKG
jgi:transposase